MKLHKTIAYLLSMLLLFGFVSCDKDNEEDVSPNLEFLTGGEWMGSAVYMNGNDITEDFNEEEGIDITRYSSLFQKDGTYSDRYDGQSVLDGTWKFENDEKIIVFDEGTDDEYSVTISKLDEDELNYIQDGYEFRFVR